MDYITYHNALRRLSMVEKQQPSGLPQEELALELKLRGEE